MCMAGYILRRPSTPSSYIQSKAMVDVEDIRLNIEITVPRLTQRAVERAVRGALFELFRGSKFVPPKRVT